MEEEPGVSSLVTNMLKVYLWMIGFANNTFLFKVLPTSGMASLELSLGLLDNWARRLVMVGALDWGLIPQRV